MLRAPEKTDIDNIYRWENHPQRLLHGRTGLPYSRLLIADYIDNYSVTALSNGQLRFMIETDEGLTAGMADLYDIDFSGRNAKVSIFVDTPCQHRGIGTSAMAELLDFARDQLGLYQVAAIVSAENQASMKFFTKCGFNAIATLPRWTRGTSGALTDATILLYRFEDC